MLSGSSFVLYLMAVVVAAQAIPSPQTIPASSTPRVAPAQNKTTPTTQATYPTPTKSPNHMSTNATIPEAHTPVVGSSTSGEGKTPTSEPTSLGSEEESPTRTTTAAPAIAGTKSEMHAKDMKTVQPNGTHSSTNKSSQAISAPISQGNFGIVIAFLSVGMLTIVV